MNNITLNYSVVASGTTAWFSPNSVSANNAMVVDAPTAPAQKSAVATQHRNLESAVFSHIKALRALGKKEVNTQEIADSLGVSRASVHATIASLLNKGVKLK